MSEYLLDIDNGNTISKAAIFDLEGREIQVASRQVKSDFPHKGWTERSMDELWQSTAAGKMAKWVPYRRASLRNRKCPYCLRSDYENVVAVDGVVVCGNVAVDGDTGQKLWSADMQRLHYQDLPGIETRLRLLLHI